MGFDRCSNPINVLNIKAIEPLLMDPRRLTSWFRWPATGRCPCRLIMVARKVMVRDVRFDRSLRFEPFAWKKAFARHSWGGTHLLLRVGRRKLLLTSIAGMIVAITGLATCLTVGGGWMGCNFVFC
ncbi:hypothetical protein Adt_34505 [Abeliophyllum distichum]|uniref:Uncharacterized protein n=1 Tax=Abeliophyllum distichum TaxID=126358 RepID=A0ABD1R2V5_9LAMI